jgi:hypothetical protein
MYYGGESNVPGAPGNLLAGVSFPIQGGSSIGKPLLPNFKEIKGDKRDPSFPPEENIPRYLTPQAGIPGSSNLPGAVGNMGGMMAQANPTFAPGSPQYGNPVPSAGNPSVPMSMNEAEMKGLGNIRNINQNYPGGYDAFLREKFGVEMTPGGYRNIQGSVPAGFDNKIVS